MFQQPRGKVYKKHIKMKRKGDKKPLRNYRIFKEQNKWIYTFFRIYFDKYVKRKAFKDL